MNQFKCLGILMLSISAAMSQRSLYQQNNYEDLRRQQLQQQPRTASSYQQRSFTDTAQQQRPAVEDTFGADLGCKDPWTTEWRTH